MRVVITPGTRLEPSLGVADACHRVRRRLRPSTACRSRIVGDVRAVGRPEGEAGTRRCPRWRELGTDRGRGYAGCRRQRRRSGGRQARYSAESTTPPYGSVSGTIMKRRVGGCVRLAVCSAQPTARPAARASSVNDRCEPRARTAPRTPSATRVSGPSIQFGGGDRLVDLDTGIGGVMQTNTRVLL